MSEDQEDELADLPVLPIEGRPRTHRSASLSEISLNGGIQEFLKPKIRHKRESLPVNILPWISGKGPIRAGSNRKMSTGEHQDTETWDAESIPEPGEQQEIIASIDAECTCTYAVSRVWFKKWEDYVGITKGCRAGEAEHPGHVEMDTNNDTNNEYVNEEIWRLFIKWFGLSTNHHLDRKHLYFKDEKMFDICILSPYSGIVEHAVKKFNRFEEIGYIECQLRRIFHISEYKKTRLWISEKSQVPRFRQLLLRFRMLNDCIHRDKMYILALEESSGTDAWPSGEPGEPKGELTKYKTLVSGPKPSDYWTNEIETSLGNLTMDVTESIITTAENFLENGKTLLKQRESQLERSQKAYENKLEEVIQKEHLLQEKSKEVDQREELITHEYEHLNKERDAFHQKEAKFKAELERMSALHQIQEGKIKLDIGGQTFTTSIHTLQKDPDCMLAGMFSGRHELKREADGSYFIDRDGTYFRYILNFLRDDFIDPATLPSDYIMIKELLREAKLYQIHRLVNYLEELLETAGQ